jgi:sugar/nucleoside kinase (ribokinase family)
MNLRFDKIIGTGGIGSGILFQSESNKTLDRNESRLAILESAKDYCKQHIILHYIANVLKNDLKVYAIGMVGKDESGIRLLDEMKAVGIDTDMVGETDSKPTMYSVCLQYPDKCVCNITAGNSACDLVTPDYIRKSIVEKKLHIDSRTLVLAVPEVPVATRIELLKMGSSHSAFCVASLLCGEALEFKKSGGLESCDLLSLNESEAKAIAGISVDTTQDVMERCCDYLHGINPGIMLIVTCGEKGSYSFFKGKIEHVASEKVIPVNTAGAGDAYIAGVICGLSIGLPFQNTTTTKNDLLRATDLGAFFAGKSIESQHTIADEIDKRLFHSFMEQKGVQVNGL